MSKAAMELVRQIEEMRAKNRSEKPPPAAKTKKQEKRADDSAESARKILVHEDVWVLDAACICGSCKPAATDEMHEVLSRAKTRGMPIEIRFSIKNCVRMSRKCHAMVTGELGHGKRLKLAFLDDALGAMGGILMTWKSGKLVTYHRRVPTGFIAHSECPMEPESSAHGRLRSPRALGATTPARTRASGPSSIPLRKGCVHP